MACRAEKKAVEQRRADVASALQQRKASKKAGLQAEPVAGTPDTAAIRIKLPNGSTAQRRFLADEPLQVQKAHAGPYLIHSINCAVLPSMAASMSCYQNIVVGNAVFPRRLYTILLILWMA